MDEKSCSKENFQGTESSRLQTTETKNDEGSGCLEKQTPVTKRYRVRQIYAIAFYHVIGTFIIQCLP